MANHFTNLEERWANVRALCSSFCNAAKNQAGLCPATCLPECPATCRYALIPPTTTAVASSARNPSRIYTFDPLFIATFASLAIGLLAMCSYAIYLKYYSAGRRPQQGPQLFGQVHQESNCLELEESVIGAGTVQIYLKKGDAHFREMECAVCLSELQDEDILRILPKCNHAFHMSCIDVWLGSKKSCPLCRACIVSSVAMKPALEHHINVNPL